MQDLLTRPKPSDAPPTRNSGVDVAMNTYMKGVKVLVCPLYRTAPSRAKPANVLGILRQRVPSRTRGEASALLFGFLFMLTQW